MKLVEHFHTGFGQMFDRMPTWLVAVVLVWFLVSSTLYFGGAELPGIEPWLWFILMAPPILLVLSGMFLMTLIVIEWIAWPVRKAVSRFRKAH